MPNAFIYRIFAPSTQFNFDLYGHGDPTPGTPITTWYKWSGIHQTWRFELGAHHPLPPWNDLDLELTPPNSLTFYDSTDGLSGILLCFYCNMRVPHIPRVVTPRLLVLLEMHSVRTCDQNKFPGRPCQGSEKPPPLGNQPSFNLGKLMKVPSM